jgi:hypothetical protein
MDKKTLPDNKEIKLGAKLSLAAEYHLMACSQALVRIVKNSNQP